MLRGVLAATAACFACVPAGAEIINIDVLRPDLGQLNREFRGSITPIEVKTGDSIFLNLIFHDRVSVNTRGLFVSAGLFRLNPSVFVSPDRFDVINPTGNLAASGVIVNGAARIAPTFKAFATGTFDGIRFQFDARTGGTVTFDSVRVRPGANVPEPATWALMIAGFGLAGAAARQRKRAAVLA